MTDGRTDAAEESEAKVEKESGRTRISERRRRIGALVRRKGFVTIEDLARQF
jgi:hypothetical protein